VLPEEAVVKFFAVLLGASLLLNLALIAGRAAPSEPAPRPAPERASAPRAPGAAAETREIERLRTRIVELEREKAAVPAPSAAPSGLREKLVRALRIWKTPRAHAASDPEDLLDLSEVTLAFQRARLERFKDPRGYVDLVRTVLEEAALDGKKPLDPAQRAALHRTLDEYEKAISGLERADAWERFTHELGPEAEVLQKLRTFCSPEQEARVMAFGGLSPWSASAAPWVDRRHAEPNVVQTWMTAYALEESQRSAVVAAARVYLNAAEALNAQMGEAAVPGRDTAEWRRRTGALLLDALGTLEGSLTPEQRQRLRSRRPAEFRLYDPAAQQRYAR
jgi:hypothetical protein